MSTSVLLVAGMAVVFANMIFLNTQIREQVAEAFAETYMRSLDGVQTALSRVSKTRLPSLTTSTPRKVQYLFLRPLVSSWLTH